MNSIGLYQELLCAAIWLQIWQKKHMIISKSIKLPRFRKGVYFYWNSSEHNIIDDKGTVNWSNLSKKTSVQFDVELVIHKSLFSDEIAEIKPVTLKFDFVILYVDEKERLERSVLELGYEQILGANNSHQDIVSDLVLPDKTDYGIHIDWESNSIFLDKNGKVYRNNQTEQAILSARFYGEKYFRQKDYEFTIRRKKQNGRKILVMVPHGDDEIFLAYNVIREAVLKNYEVNICFFCNVDTKGTSYAASRHKESINACGYLGVPKENIYILGYSTKWKYSHIYNNPTGIMESKHGKTCTYGSGYLTDWHTLRYGRPADYTRGNIVSDIEDVINVLRPDIIFTNDFDRHLDHIAYSLLFDEAMGNLLKTNRLYRPVVYKGFCYATSAYSKPSLFNMVCQNTPKPGKSKKYYDIYADTQLENPAYLWKDRVRFKTRREFLNKNINQNSAAYAIKLYNRMYRNIPCFIHGDEVFWKRRTDSITYIADIRVTSGVSEYLNDFKLTDVKRLKQPPYCFHGGEWIPDQQDKEKKIIFRWEEEHAIKRIRFYRNPTDNYVKEVQICCNLCGGGETYKLFMNKNTTYKDIYIADRTSVLEIKILNGSNKRSGFSEIEIYEES
jgi:LmbE family N-acetylglucosaminyl deacetylase